MYMPKGKRPTANKRKEDKNMWSQGTIGIPDGEGKYTNCRYWVKHYDEPSEEYGIDRGRISKLEIRVNGKTTLNYDRGWDIEPEDEATQLAFAVLMQKYN
jgi:hypothetical protein